MAKEFEKIFLVGIIGLLAFVTIYGMLSFYSSYLIQSRQLSYLLVKTQLSSLTDAEKKNILTDIYMNVPRDRKVGLDFSRSLANFDAHSKTATQCIGILEEFQKQAVICLGSTPNNPISVAMFSCPLANKVAEDLITSCNIDLNWK